MPSLYDSLDTPTLLPELNVGSSNGWVYGTNFYAGGANNTTYPHTMVDLCVHQGVLHAAWVEPINSAGSKLAYGPYVSKLVSGSWTALGGEVNSGKDHVDVNDAWNGYNRGETAGNGECGRAIGTTWYPSRPRLASDGTDLYLAYVEHICELAPNPPPNGSWTTDGHGSGDAYGFTVSGTSHKTWAPMRVRIFKWSGSAWVSFGDMPAITNNTMVTGELEDVGNVPGMIGCCASSAEPGVVYVSFSESGFVSSVPGYVASPTFFVGFIFGARTWSPWKSVLRWGRFTSGGSTIKVVSEENSAGDAFSHTNTSTHARLFSYHEPFNDSGDAYLVWGGNTYSNPDNVLTLTRWSDLAVVQDSGPSDLYLGTNNTRMTKNSSKFFAQIGNNPNSAVENPIVSVPLNASSDFVAFDGTTRETKTPTPNYFETIVADGNKNIWGIGRYSMAAQLTGPVTWPGGGPYDIYYYAFDCPKWRVGQVSYSSGLNRFLRNSMAVLGDNLYVAASHFKLSDATYDLKALVYELPILRDSETCPVTDVFLEGETSLLIHY